ncbi:hypothetical protein V8E54_005890 [Elaphomyces granulatus]
MELCNPPQKRPRIFEYSCPEIPKNDQDAPGTSHDNPWKIRSVRSTTSRIWGTGETAAFRAVSVNRVTNENERLVRTWHPALASLDEVCVSESKFGPAVWLVGSPVSAVEAGGRPIRLFLGDHTEFIPRGILTPRSPHDFNMPFRRDINPRRFLTRIDLDSFRELFPRAVGVQVLIAGFIIVFFDSVSDVEEAYSTFWPLELGSLRVFFDTSRLIEFGIGDEGYATEGEGELGLKIILPDGTRASKFGQRLHLWYKNIKAALARYRPARLDQDDATYLVLQEPSGNSPIGKEVFLALSNRKCNQALPSGYLHDLSLVTEPDLPDVVISPPGYLVSEWADYSAALGGEPVYAVCHQTDLGRWRCMEGTPDTTIIDTGYTWNKLEKSQNAYLLWRTDPLFSPADGWSGSVPCLGKPTNTSSKAVVFQNFQRHCLLEERDARTGKRKDALIKAGFVLPQSNTARRKANTSPGGSDRSGEGRRQVLSGA